MVQHTKREAAKALRKDERVDTVLVRPNFMVIKTMPLKTDGSFHPELVLKPTGTYTITIKYLKSYDGLEIKMIRREGWVTSIHSSRRHHLHIDDSNTYNRVCFGSAQSEVNKICNNSDWYWVGVMCLNLLEDFTDHNTSVVRAIEHLVVAQIKYVKDEKFTERIKKKVINIIKKDKKLMESYLGECNFFVEVGET